MMRGTSRAILLMTPPTVERLDGQQRAAFDRGVAKAFPACAVVTTDDPQPLHRELRAFDPDVIIAAGGDGTVNLALQAMREQDSLALLPLGTANDLARFLGVQRNPAFLGSFVYSSACRIDVLRVNGQRFCTTGGLGLPAEVADRVNRLRNDANAVGKHKWLDSLGPAIYSVIGAERSLCSPPLHRLSIVWEDLADGTERRVELQSHGLFVTNQSTFACSLQLVREANNSDGVFELCVLLVRGRVALLRLLGNLVRQRQLAAGDVKIIRTRRAMIEADREVRFYGDGEVLAKSSSFALGIEPAALRLLS